MGGGRSGSCSVGRDGVQFNCWGQGRISAAMGWGVGWGMVSPTPRGPLRACGAASGSCILDYTLESHRVEG